jgi:hypothetical protein
VGFFLFQPAIQNLRWGKRANFWQACSRKNSKTFRLEKEAWNHINTICGAFSKGPIQQGILEKNKLDEYLGHWAKCIMQLSFPFICMQKYTKHILFISLLEHKQIAYCTVCAVSLCRLGKTGGYCLQV